MLYKKFLLKLHIDAKIVLKLIYKDEIYVCSYSVVCKESE